MAGAALDERPDRARDLVGGAVDDRVADDLGRNGLGEPQRLGAPVRRRHEAREPEGALAERGSAPRAAKASAGRVSAMNLISSEPSIAASASSRVSATTTRA